MEYRANNYINDVSDDDDNKSHIFSSTKKRIFYIYGDIDARNCADIAFDIIGLNQDDDEKERKEKGFRRDPIKLFINSFGGYIYDMWSLIDTIALSKTPVYTYCTGYAMSAAFQIFLSGHKRFVTTHSTLMYHQIHCGGYGKYQDLVDDREHMDFMNKQIEDYVISKTNLTKKFLSQTRTKKKDTYFNAKEAIKYRIADEIINPCKGEETDK